MSLADVARSLRVKYHTVRNYVRGRTDEAKKVARKAECRESYALPPVPPSTPLEHDPAWTSIPGPGWLEKHAALYAKSEPVRGYVDLVSRTPEEEYRLLLRAMDAGVI